MSYYPSSLRKIGLTAVTNDTTVSIPAGHAIASVTVINTTANAITGGIKIGTTNGGTDVCVALAVGANAKTSISDVAMLKRFFSSSVDTTLYIQDVSAWNSASLSIIFLVVKV